MSTGKRSIPQQPNQPGPTLVNLAVSSTNTYHSAVLQINLLDNVGLDISLTGTMTGTITVECSIDGNTYRALTFDPVLTQPAGSSVAFLVSLNQLPYPYLRVSYVNASGSGTFKVVASAKGL